MTEYGAGRDWVFDVDGTLIDALTASELRPGAADLLGRLREQESTVIWWSAGGAEYAERRALNLGLGHLVSSYHSKEGRDGAGYYRTDHLPIDTGQAIFVDDQPEDLRPELTVVTVPCYLTANRYDRALVGLADDKD